ncbi:MAG: MFS transporter [Armatimonadetes bacterium]|nr:MFS transporter [Armatimonadota bacterium]MDE2207784.1 MFS transporter [Armatimonadota bacterium]
MTTYQPPPRGFRTFRILWLTQSVSVFGSALTYFAINIWLAQSMYPLPAQKRLLAWSISAVSLAFVLPTFIAPLAGAWADRHDRKRIMIVMDLLSTCLSSTLAWLLLEHRLAIAPLLILTVLFALAAQFHGAAFDTCYSMLVTREQLPRANGMMQTMWYLSSMASPAVAALIISAPALLRHTSSPSLIPHWLRAMPNGMPLVVCVDAVTFLMAALTMTMLHVPSPERHDLMHADGITRKSIWDDVRDGARFVLQRKPLVWLLSTFAVVNFAAAPAMVLVPLLVKYQYAADWARRHYTFAAALGLLATIASVGGFAGGLVVSLWGGLRRRRVAGILLPLTANCALIVVYATTHSYPTAVVLTFCIMATGPIANAHSQAIWQGETPPPMQGRVFSVRRLIAQFTAPLSTSVAGWAAGLYGASPVVAGMGLFGAVCCAVQWLNPVIWQAGTGSEGGAALTTGHAVE